MVGSRLPHLTSPHLTSHEKTPPATQPPFPPFIPFRYCTLQYSVHTHPHKKAKPTPYSYSYIPAPPYFCISFLFLSFPFFLFVFCLFFFGRGAEELLLRNSCSCFACLTRLYSVLCTNGTYLLRTHRMYLRREEEICMYQLRISYSVSNV